MPGKTKQDYLDLPFNAGDNRAKMILADAISDKGVEPTLKCMKYLAGGQVMVCVCKGAVEQEGTGATKAEAIADACSKH